MIGMAEQVIFRSSYSRYLGVGTWGMETATGIALVVVAAGGTTISLSGRLAFGAMGVAATIGGVAGSRRILRLCLKVEPATLTVVAFFKTVAIERAQVVGIRVLTQNGYTLALELMTGKRVRVQALDYPTRRRADAARRALCEALNLTT